MSCPQVLRVLMHRICCIYNIFTISWTGELVKMVWCCIILFFTYSPSWNATVHCFNVLFFIQVIDSSSIEKTILKYRREKISSPTVDSTTDNIIQICPLQFDCRKPKLSSQKASNMFTIPVGHSEGSSTQGSWTSQSFIPIDSPCVGYSSQESGIKVETQSMLDEDTHFQGKFISIYSI